MLKVNTGTPVPLKRFDKHFLLKHIRNQYFQHNTHVVGMKQFEHIWNEFRHLYFYKEIKEPTGPVFWKWHI